MTFTTLYKMMNDGLIFYREIGYPWEQLQTGLTEEQLKQLFLNSNIVILIVSRSDYQQKKSEINFLEKNNFSAKPFLGDIYCKKGQDQSK